MLIAENLSSSGTPSSVTAQPNVETRHIVRHDDPRKQNVLARFAVNLSSSGILNNATALSIAGRMRIDEEPERLSMSGAGVHEKQQHKQATFFSKVAHIIV